MFPSLPAVSGCLHRQVRRRSSLCMGTAGFMQKAIRSREYNTCLHKSCGTAVHHLILEAISRMSPWTRSDNWNNQLECHSVAASNQDGTQAFAKLFRKWKGSSQRSSITCQEVWAKTPINTSKKMHENKSSTQTSTRSEQQMVFGDFL